MDRRKFIQRTSAGLGLLGVGAFPLQALGDPELTKLIILHTNDLHSRLEPFPMDGGEYQGLGGAARRASLIKKVRSEEEQVLLLDSGDIFQGTPYFNFFLGEPEMKLMSAMGYDAATIGNHDFDAGVDGLYNMMPHANFPLISSNYDFSDTVLYDSTLPWKTFQKGAIKVGVLGVGIALQGLVAEELYKKTQYLDPIQQANKTARHLRHEEKCDLIICLSHLGYYYRDATVSDCVLAKETENIDIILGGHTHTFMERPDVHKNKQGMEVIINQVGWAGIVLGRLDVYFEKNRKSKCISCSNRLID